MALIHFHDLSHPRISLQMNAVYKWGWFGGANTDCGCDNLYAAYFGTGLLLSYLVCCTSPVICTSYFLCMPDMRSFRVRQSSCSSSSSLPRTSAVLSADARPGLKPQRRKHDKTASCSRCCDLVSIYDVPPGAPSYTLRLSQQNMSHSVNGRPRGNGRGAIRF